MKLKSIVLCCLSMVLIVSCIQEEAPNAEADILACTVPGDILKTEPEITNESVTLTVRSDADVTNLAPWFTLTLGATISPANGTAQDFTTPVEYTVRSEDTHWEKKYMVRCIVSGLSTDYHFENISMEPKNERFQIFYDVLPSGDKVDWGSGNGGFAITGVAKSPDQYPTSQSEDGYKGKCAKLVTRSTGSLGALVKMYLAAGNLFVGTFDAASALTDARKATHFGKPFEYVPTYLSGYYKYKAGSEYSSGGKVVAGKKDQCDIYAIFYETDKDVTYLDGTNALTSPNLISVARISDAEETGEWTHFYIPFIAQPGKVIDKEKLKKGGYQLAVIFSSSIKGDTFEGAVGSTLYIDEVEVIYSSNE